MNIISEIMAANARIALAEDPSDIAERDLDLMEVRDWMRLKALPVSEIPYPFNRAYYAHKLEVALAKVSSVS